MDIKLISIDKIGLSNRATNALHRAEVHTVGDLLEQTEESLKTYRNLGTKSIEEILNKKEEYRNVELNGYPSEEKQTDIPYKIDEIISGTEGREFVLSWLEINKIKISKLDLLSTKAFNLLMINGYDYLYKIVFLKQEDFLSIPRMDTVSADEIVKNVQYYLVNNADSIVSAYADSKCEKSESSKITLFEMIRLPRYHDKILEFVKIHDKDLSQINLSNRSYNHLIKNGYQHFSDIIFLTRSELQRIPALGYSSVKEITDIIESFLSDNEHRIKAFCNGDESELYNDVEIRRIILELYNDFGFAGLSLQEFEKHMQLPETISENHLKKIIGKLLAEKELEYVDFRCYRVYERFEEHIDDCDSIDQRGKEILHKRLEGLTLEKIAQDYGITRERVRQICKKAFMKLGSWYRNSATGRKFFDEDYYKYFYETYSFDKQDAYKWFGMTPDVFNYFNMLDIKQGDRDLETALDDNKNLEAGLRLKIKNYLNRNKIFIDGVWIEKRRADLEELVVRKCCKDNVSFDDFSGIYNDFLEHEGIDYDEDLYYTDAIVHTRENKLSNSRFLLWKLNKQIRYYDIDSRDYSELLNTLNLESFENIEISTLRFVEDYPELMEKYDIRDQYELHNLLRKIVPDGSFNDFHIERMPIIGFGVFDKKKAFMDILKENSPISTYDLCQLIHNEYGYDIGTIQATHLNCLAEYRYMGEYRIDQKVMCEEHMAGLKNNLKEDFYFIDEIKKVFAQIYPDADPDEINPYNLKRMGFIVVSSYVLQHHDSFDAYFEHLLTKEDIIDITPYRKRFVYVQTFSAKYMYLKRNMEIVEFEPNQIINFRKLEQSGVTKDQIRDFCDQVFDFVDEGTYFSVRSIKKGGFETELFDLGFSDWFYANLLISDDRFSFGQMYGTIIIYKGNSRISIQSFELSRIKEHKSIDFYDFLDELVDFYGCENVERSKVTDKLKGTEVYYDGILDRLYANKDMYYQELDEAEEI